MQKRWLNRIIIVSIVGIFIFGVKDYLFKKKEIPIAPSLSQIPTQKPIPSNPEVPCEHPYFSFKKGTTWKYQTQVTATQEEKTSKIINNFSSTIEEASPSSVLIGTSIQGKKEKITTKLSCRKNGVYGLPFPLEVFFDKTASEAAFLTSVIPSSSFLFLPSSEKLTENTTWDENFTFATVHYETKGEKKVTINQDKTVTTLPITTDLVFTQDVLASFNEMTDDLFTYEIAKGVGITTFTLSADIPEDFSILATVRLTTITIP
ncbi:MAG TPA: hypothetical protein VJH96_03740 [Patescibacteria group bacterium]|nr:hypothetical protein [Patescibacteria group bacterium]